MKSLKAAAKRLIPRQIMDAYVRRRLYWDMTKSRGQSRQVIFSDIYENSRWGGVAGSYNSGSGSQADVNESYVASVRKLIHSEGVNRIVDLGCGDFRVAQRLLSPKIRYIGCDLVPGLVARNMHQYGTESVEFRVLDIVTDPLPQGDLCIIRQVFQHLSNADIATVLSKTRQYPLVLVTDEQLVSDNSCDNVDIIAYHGTRRLFGQGLKLEAAPFFERVETLLEHSAGSELPPAGGTYLRTVLIRNR